MGRVEGKVAIITGGGRGQGAAEARLLASEGAAVAVCDVLQEESQSVVADIVASGGDARSFPMDVFSAGIPESIRLVLLLLG